MSDWIAVAQLDDVPALGARVYIHNQKEVAIFRTSDDQVFALNNRCPHQGAPLSAGMVHGTSVTCPLHNWKIDLTTGEALAPDRGCSGNYETKLTDGTIYIKG